MTELLTKPIVRSIEVACANNDSGGFFPAPTYDLAAALAADTTYTLVVGSRSRPEAMINDVTFAPSPAAVPPT